MLNIIRADLGRIFSSKGIYITLGIFIFMFVMHVMGQAGGFDVATARLAGHTMVFYMMLLVDNIYLTMIPIIYFIVSDDFEHGTAKNALATGVSRVHFYIGKLVVALLFCILLYVLQLGGGAGLTTLIYGFGAEFNSEFIWRVFQSALPQLFALLSITAVGVFLAFLIRKPSWFSIGYAIFILGPGLIIGFLLQMDESLYFLWDFELLTQTRNLLNVANMPTHEIWFVLGVVTVYFVVSTVGGLAWFKKSEIK